MFSSATILRLLLLTTLTFSLSSCADLDPQASDLKLRNLKTSEALADFDDIVARIHTLYGPLEFKEKRHGFDFKALAKEYRAKVRKAKTDPEVFGVFKQFLTRLEDGHVSIQFPANSTGIEKFSIPIFIEPFGNEVIVTGVDSELSQFLGIKVGDQLLTVDGKDPLAYLPTIKKYEAIGMDSSEQHFVYKVLDRPVYITELKPSKLEADLVLRRDNGTQYSISIPWRLKKGLPSKELAPGLNFTWSAASDMNSVVAGLDKMGAVNPIFDTEETRTKFQLTPVTPAEESLEQFEFEAEIPVGVYAVKYTMDGKNILLIRNSTYYPGDGKVQENYMKYYRALLSQEQDTTDVLIVDQTHNGGGSYCMDFAALFYKEEGNGFVQAMNADRKWINDFKKSASTMDPNSFWREKLLTAAAKIEMAYDSGVALTEPLSWFGETRQQPDAGFHWEKPLLVVMDELDGSCADAFPALIKNNHAAKLFGQKTMGLGGNVEEVTNLSNSGATLRLTRGMFTTFRPDGVYPEASFVENNGVTPDYEYTRTAEDFRNGYVGYFEAFSKKALEQIK
jgi:C-terminal processing protease CtpA/Prc